MAGVYKRGNLYWAFWRVGGKSVRRSTGVKVKDGVNPGRELRRLAGITAEAMERAAKAASPAMAVAAVDAVKSAAMAAGMEIEAAEMSLREWAEAWKKTQKSKKSFANCERAIRNFLEILGERADKGISQITPAEIDDWAERRLDKVSAGTVDREAAEVSAMFNRAVREGRIDRNPAVSYRMPAWAKNEKQERDPMTVEQIQIILREFPGEWPDLVRVCLLLGGQRLGDVAGLRWSQIEWDVGLIRLRTQKTSRNMTKPIIEPLRRILERRKRETIIGDDRVFPYSAIRIAEAGGNTSKLSIEFGKLLEKYGIRETKEQLVAKYGNRRAGRLMSKLSFHSLRSTATTFLLLAGVPPVLVQHIVGHDSAEIERAHYFKPGSDAEAEAMRKMADFLS